MEQPDLSLLSKPVNSVNASVPSFFRAEAGGKSIRTSLDGTWEFVYLDGFDPEKFAKLDELGHASVPVPSTWETTGYNKPDYLNVMYEWEGREDLKNWELPEKNPVGIYSRTVELDGSDKNRYLEINGFLSAMYLFVNGKFAGYSANGYMTNTFDISGLAVPGKNRIDILVFRFSLASWITDQDMWRFHGLFRSVDLVEVPHEHLSDIKVRPDYVTKTREGKLSLKVFTENASEGSKVRAVLKDGEQILFSEEKDAVSGKATEFTGTFPKIKPWSDEIPNLYALEVSLVRGESELEKATLMIGFRNIRIRDGVILLNGKRVLFRGVNRHEFCAETGSVVTPELDEQDIRLLKAYNFNAIRCSHYPNINEFYELCDRYGILVVDEAAIETHGTWQFNTLDKKIEKTEQVLPGNDPRYRDFIVGRGTDMLKRDFNHPCIVFWSVGNEAYAGKNLLALADRFREMDPSRLVHYEGNSWEYPKWQEMSDVVSRMYPHPWDIRKFLKKHHDKPYILCEFEHSMGNSTGNFGEYMALEDEFPQFQGGFIWDFVDQGLRDQDGILRYGGDFGDYPNDSNFCADGLLLADRSVTSKMREVRYWYSPLKISLDARAVRIENRLLFKDTSDLCFLYEAFGRKGVLYSEEFFAKVLPGSAKSVYLKKVFPLPKDGFCYARVTVKLAADTAYAPKGTVLKEEEKFLLSSLEKADGFAEPAPSSQQDEGLRVYESVHHLTVRKGDFKVIFSGRKAGGGGLEAIEKGGHLFLQRPVLPTLYRPTTDNDNTFEKFFLSFYLGGSKYPIYIPFVRELKVKEKSKDKVVVSVPYILPIGAIFRTVRVTYTVYADETVRVHTSFKKAAWVSPALFGLRFRFEKEYSSFSYSGKGPYENYPDRHLGENFGTYESDAEKEYVPYSMPQECGNHLYTREVLIHEGKYDLVFSALSKSFSFKYLPYDEFVIDNAERNTDLPASNGNYLTLCGFNKGIGGDDSWGSRVHKPYRKMKHRTDLDFLISVREA